jgi:GNAT superfamily N-acetyltransferase
LTTSSRPAVRPARSADLEALVEIYLSSARHHAAIDAAFYEIPDRAAATERLSRFVDRAGPDGAYLVAEVGGQVVGSLTIRRMDDPGPGSMIRGVPAAEVGVAVLDAARGSGVGRALMMAAEEWAAHAGIGRIFLDVNANNTDALRFYRRLGYGTRAEFLDKAVADGDLR